MQVQIIKAQHNGTCARPATGSAFLAGHVVTVTVPTLAISDGLLAMGDNWAELRFSQDDDRMRAHISVAPNATNTWQSASCKQHPGTPHG